MKAELSEPNEGKRPVAMIRNGKLFLGLNAPGDMRKAAYINRNGVVELNGTAGVEDMLRYSPEATPIYPGDKVTLTF